MSDIFISYSRKDSEQALHLAERLRAEGMSVWIDQQGIEAAKTWSEEIVNAIEGSKAFVLLLSSHSIESGNVAKELSLAYEAERHLLPVALEDVTLTPKFKYPLAGVQRVAYSQFDSITSALLACGVTQATTKAKKQDDRKSLLVMPFEDLSPTQDNRWLADGFAGELIDRLSHVKALRLVDRTTSRDLRNSRLGLFEIAKTLEVRYVVEGSVRKFDDQIKISTALIDVLEGEHRWQESFRGLMCDVFGLQESVAQRVTEALHVSLGIREHAGRSAEITRDPAAYELHLRAQQHYNKLTLESMELAVSQYREAVTLDPTFAEALHNLIIGLLELYRMKGKPDSYLQEARSYIEQIRQQQGESFEWCWATSTLLLRCGDIEAAERFARRAVALKPERAGGHDILGLVLKAKGDHRAAADALLEYIRFKKTPHAYEKLLSYLSEAGDRLMLREKAVEARPLFERHLALHPDDLHMASTYASILYWTEEPEKALEQVTRLLAYPLSAHATYNLSCLLCDLDQLELATDTLRNAIAAGYSDLESISADPDLAKLWHTKEFKRLTAGAASQPKTGPNA